jgi:hypothetical protein
VKALTVPQPWASALIAGRCRVINMPFRIKLSRPFTLAIHASRMHQRWPPSLRNIVKRYWPECDRDQLPYGAVLGTARLTRILPSRHPSMEADPWAKGPWCWTFERARLARESTSWPDKRGLWTVPPHILEQLGYGPSKRKIQPYCQCGMVANVLTCGLDKMHTLSCPTCANLAHHPERPQKPA